MPDSPFVLASEARDLALQHAATLESAGVRVSSLSRPGAVPRLGGVSKVAAMGETRVDLLHLLEDLRDAYPGALEETILTEIVANSLDSGARRIRLDGDPGRVHLTVIDDGAGMQRRELARYHDIAASTKTRGQGIGFAGVGIKLGLLACERGADRDAARRDPCGDDAGTWHRASGRHGNGCRRRDSSPSGARRCGSSCTNPLSPLLDRRLHRGGAAAPLRAAARSARSMRSWPATTRTACGSR